MLLRDGQVVLVKSLDGKFLVSAQVLCETKGYGKGYHGVGKYYDLVVLEGKDKGVIKTVPQVMILSV